jgi:FkbM family methyltransferase
MNIERADLPRTVKVVRGDLEIAFVATNEATAWRAQSVMSKEPGTVSWIEEFAPGEVFVDIGANVGIYSLCAARFKGVRVIAFEPESQNYAILNQNIHLNGLDDQITAYCVALSDATRFDRLSLGQFLAGGSCHTFGADLDYNLQQRGAAFRQGCFATTLDALVADGVVPVPQHIKIDVDGLEHAVIKGAAATIAHAGVRSVLVEINTALDEHWQVIDQMLARGFEYSEAEADAARRNAGPFTGVGNYVFRRR